MPIPLTALDVQFQITTICRAWIKNHEDMVRAKTFLDQANLMAAPYGFTQAENDIIRLAVEDAIYGWSTTTRTNIEKQAGLF